MRNDPNIMVTKLLRPKPIAVTVCRAIGVQPPLACLTLQHRLTKKVKHVQLPVELLYDGVQVP